MLKVILTNGNEDLILDFKLRNTDIANKWFTELSKNYPLYETDRFSNWGSHDFVKQLNNQINIINAYQPIIDKQVSEFSTQQELNYLHKFFEDLRGDIIKGTDWYNSAPAHIQEAVCRFNILIHQLESSIRTGNTHPTLVVTFSNTLRLNLSEKDMREFTYKWKQNTVYINYCQNGKTVLDVFKDNDTMAEAIRPQIYYSADFMIKFGPSTHWLIYLIRSVIIKIWLLRKRFPFKNLNIGMIPVADLVTSVDKSTLLKFNKVKSVVCLK